MVSFDYTYSTLHVWHCSVLKNTCTVHMIHNVIQTLNIVEFKHNNVSTSSYTCFATGSDMSIVKYILLENTE